MDYSEISVYRFGLTFFSFFLLTYLFICWSTNIQIFIIILRYNSIFTIFKQTSNILYKNIFHNYVINNWKLRDIKKDTISKIPFFIIIIMTCYGFFFFFWIVTCNDR